VVEPEIDQDLLELVLAVDGPDDLGRVQLVENGCDRALVGVVEGQDLGDRVAERGQAAQPGVQLGISGRVELLLDVAGRGPKPMRLRRWTATRGPMSAGNGAVPMTLAAALMSGA